MKKQCVFLLVLSLAVTLSIIPEVNHEKLRDNLIKNGNFQKYTLKNRYDFFSRIKNWRAVGGKGEIGTGNLYNSNWNPTSLVLQLDSLKNIAYKTKFFGCREGSYEISFDYAAREGHPLETSGFIVKVNGRKIQRIVPNNYNVNHKTYIVNGKKGKNVIKFIAIGASDTYGATIANIECYENNGNGNLRENLIRNGHFEEYTLNRGHDYFTGTSITNWQVIGGKGEIGKGTVYNRNWNSNTKVLELDSYENVSYKTKFTGCRRGSYELAFDFAPRQGHSLDTSQFIVKVNGEKIDEIVPPNYNVNHKSYIINGQKGENVVQFVAAGSSNTFGATIGNVDCFAS